MLARDRFYFMFVSVGGCSGDVVLGSIVLHVVIRSGSKIVFWFQKCWHRGKLDSRESRRCMGKRVFCLDSRCCVSVVLSVQVPPMHIRRPKHQE